MTKVAISVSSDSCAPASILVALCFEARTKIHFAHLLTTSYAEHKALNAYYDGIVGIADTFAESYMGKYGRFPVFPKVEIVFNKGSEVIECLRSWIAENRADCGSDSYLQNIIDEIQTLNNQSLYLLEMS
jgi:Family of unknown function (DUF5856)